MRTAIRICLAVALVLLFGLGLLVRHLLDLGDQYHAASYVFDLIRAPECAPKPLQSGFVEQGDKVIVMGRLEEEDVSWVEEELPEYATSITHYCTACPKKSATTDTSIQLATRSLHRQPIPLLPLRPNHPQNPTEQR